MTDTNQWTGTKIIELIKEQFGSVNAFAEKYNLVSLSIYHCAHGNGSRQGRLIIARLINKKPSEIWNDRSLKRFRDDRAFSKEE